MKILFKGRLETLYPDGIEVAGDTVAECVTGLQNFPGFRREDGQEYQVVIPGFASKDALYEVTDVKTIRMVEIAEGAGGKVGAFLMVAIGVVLIATGVGAPGGVALLGTSISASTLLSVGAMMVLQGVIGLLTPAPSKSSGSDNGERSNYLSGAGKNTVRIGTRIPMIFGEVKVFGHFLSYNVTASRTIPPDPEKEMPADSNGQYLVAGAWRGNGEPDYTISNNTADGL